MRTCTIRNDLNFYVVVVGNLNQMIELLKNPYPATAHNAMQRCLIKDCPQQAGACLRERTICWRVSLTLRRSLIRSGANLGMLTSSMARGEEVICSSPGTIVHW